MSLRLKGILIIENFEHSAMSVQRAVPPGSLIGNQGTERYQYEKITRQFINDEMILVEQDSRNSLADSHHENCRM